MPDELDVVVHLARPHEERGGRRGTCNVLQGEFQVSAMGTEFTLQGVAVTRNSAGVCVLAQCNMHRPSFPRGLARVLGSVPDTSAETGLGISDVTF